jgi:hypothetical protein
MTAVYAHLSTVAALTVAFPIPGLAPVTIATDFDMIFSCDFENGGVRRLSLNQSGGGGGVARRSFQENADAFGDLAGMRFQGEVAGVDEADHRARNVPLERLGGRRQKERIVLAPHRQ